MRRFFIIWAYFLGAMAWAQSTSDFVPKMKMSQFTQEYPSLNLIQSEEKIQPQKQQVKRISSTGEVLDKAEAKRVQRRYEDAPEF